MPVENADRALPIVAMESDCEKANKTLYWVLFAMVTYVHSLSMIIKLSSLVYTLAITFRVALLERLSVSNTAGISEMLVATRVIR